MQIHTLVSRAMRYASETVNALDSQHSKYRRFQAAKWRNIYKKQREAKQAQAKREIYTWLLEHPTKYNKSLYIGLIERHEDSVQGRKDMRDWLLGHPTQYNNDLLSILAMSGVIDDV